MMRKGSVSVHRLIARHLDNIRLQQMRKNAFAYRPKITSIIEDCFVSTAQSGFISPLQFEDLMLRAPYVKKYNFELTSDLQEDILDMGFSEGLASKQSVYFCGLCSGIVKMLGVPLFEQLSADAKTMYGFR